MTEHEFDQLLAEFIHLNDRELVFTAVERAAGIFGWPIPAQYREDVILGLCTIFPPPKPAKSPAKLH